MMHAGHRRLPAVRSVAALLALASVACAPTHVQQTQTYSGAALPRPDIVVVNDFAVTPDQVKLDSGLRARLMNVVNPTPPSAQEIAEGRQVTAAISRTLVEEIRKLGLPARQALLGESPGAGNRLIIDGQMVSIDEGNRTRRNLIGLGAGHSTVQADMQVYYDSSNGARLLESYEGVAESSRKPGAAETMGAGAATGRVAESAAVGAGTSAISGSDADADAQRMAKEIAKKLSALFQRQGWIPAGT
ncbi:MAG TPA: DUF4410 domain-containing protein [Stellaceae bacterium]|nr:DUF4410 domain-containing protein [Stellaceae bacterium]